MESPHPEHCSSKGCDNFEREIFKVQYRWNGWTIEYNARHCKTGTIPAVVSPLLCGLLSAEHMKIYDTEKEEYVKNPDVRTSAERCLCSRGCGLAMSMIDTIAPSKPIFVHKIIEIRDPETVNVYCQQ